MTSALERADQLLAQLDVTGRDRHALIQARQLIQDAKHEQEVARADD